MFLLSRDYWEVKKIPKKGRGIIAKKNIFPGTVIGDYLGLLLSVKNYDEDKYGHYNMYFNKTTCIYPQNTKSDGVHLINHSCSANCDTFPHKGHTLYFASRYIFKGEELTVQYLLDPPEKHHICNHVCYCNSLVCHGTMHTTTAVYKRVEEFIKKLGEDKYEKKLPVSLGQLLPRLDSYPSSISDDPIYDLFGDLSQTPFVYGNSIIPSIQEMRKKIRETGKVLYLTHQKMYVYGIMNGLIIGMKDIKKG